MQNEHINSILQFPFDDSMDFLNANDSFENCVIVVGILWSFSVLCSFGTPFLLHKYTSTRTYNK